MKSPDLCLNCGMEHESEFAGALCSCSSPNVVHQEPCNGCGRLIGVMPADDCLWTEKLYCPDCIDDVARTRRTLAYLKKKEWSMGNGQCPECCGMNPGIWYSSIRPHPVALTPGHEGHIRGCELAEAIEEVGGVVKFRTVE
jgi:hypothetical protein